MTPLWDKQVKLGAGTWINFDISRVFNITVFELTRVFAIIYIENTIGTGDRLPHKRGIRDYPCSRYWYSPVFNYEAKYKWHKILIYRIVVFNFISLTEKFKIKTACINNHYQSVIQWKCPKLSCCDKMLMTQEAIFFG